MIEAFASRDSGNDDGRNAFCLVVMNLNEFLYLD